MDPERAGYLKAIERRFLEMRGRGLMLSPRDVMLVDRWRERGIPLRVVLAALEEGAERFAETHPKGEPLPSSLAYFEGHVRRAADERHELAVERATRGDTGRTAHLLRPQARPALLDGIAAAGRRQGGESAKEALRYAWRRLAKPSSDEALWSLVAEVDRDLVDMLAATLEDTGREALSKAVEAAVDNAGGEAMSEQAKDDVARTELERWIRERFGLRDLMEVLIEHTM